MTPTLLAVQRRSHTLRVEEREERCKKRIVRYISNREARIIRAKMHSTRGVDAVRKQPNKREQANAFDLRSTITPSRRRRHHLGRLVLFPGCAAVADSGCWLCQSATNSVSSSLAHLRPTLLSKSIKRFAVHAREGHLRQCPSPSQVIWLPAMPMREKNGKQRRSRNRNKLRHHYVIFPARQACEFKRRSHFGR